MTASEPGQSAYASSYEQDYLAAYERDFLTAYERDFLAAYERDYLAAYERDFAFAYERKSELRFLTKLIEGYFSAPENITVARLAAAASAIQAAAGRRSLDALPLSDVTRHLQSAGLVNIPFSIVAELARLAAELPPGTDLASKLTLAQAAALVRYSD